MFTTRFAFSIRNPCTPCTRVQIHTHVGFTPSLMLRTIREVCLNMSISAFVFKYWVTHTSPEQPGTASTTFWKCHRGVKCESIFSDFLEVPLPSKCRQHYRQGYRCTSDMFSYWRRSVDVARLRSVGEGKALNKCSGPLGDDVRTYEADRERCKAVIGARRDSNYGLNLEEREA